MFTIKDIAFILSVYFDYSNLTPLYAYAIDAVKNGSTDYASVSLVIKLYDRVAVELDNTIEYLRLTGELNSD